MKPEEYYQQRKVEGDKEWARLLAKVEEGKHPTPDELATAIYLYGIEPVSDTARDIAWYVANRLAHKIGPPRGRDGSPRSGRPDDATLAWFYNFEIEGLRVQRKADENEYTKLHEGAKPAEVARKAVAKQFSVGETTIKRLPKKARLK